MCLSLCSLGTFPVFGPCFYPGPHLIVRWGSLTRLPRRTNRGSARADDGPCATQQSPDMNPGLRMPRSGVLLVSCPGDFTREGCLPVLGPGIWQRSLPTRADRSAWTRWRRPGGCFSRRPALHAPCKVHAIRRHKNDLIRGISIPSRWPGALPFISLW